MPQAPSSRFRSDTPLEAIARALPSSGVLGRVRRMLKPAFEVAIAWWESDAVESRFPGGEVVRVAAAWRNLSWSADEYAAFREATRPGDVVIDGGANAGGYAVLFGQWVGPTGRVYAFEPDPRAFAALEDHVALNGLTDRVVPVRAALTARSGTVRFRLARASGLSRLAHSPYAGTEGVDVPAVSIDDFCAREHIRPSVIKIDVEGAELAVLRGARKTIASAGARLSVFVEMHPRLWPDVGVTATDIVRECGASHLMLERLDGRCEGLWEVDGLCLRLRASAVA